MRMRREAFTRTALPGGTASGSAFRQLVHGREPALARRAGEVVAREVAHGDQAHAGGGAVLADGVVVDVGSGAELVHVAEHGHGGPAVGDGDQVVDSGAHGDRVGVVGVVEQQPAAGQLGEGAAEVAEGDLTGALRGLVEPVPELDERGHSGQRVAQVVAAGEAEVHARAVAERVEQHVRALAAALLGDHVHVGVVCAEGHHPAAVTAHVPVKQALVSRHDGGAAVGELVDELRLGGGHVLDGADELKVHRRDVRDHADVRLGDARQLADLPGAAHGHLDHRDFRRALDLEQRERHPDLVVQVRGGGHGAGHRREQRPEDVLCGGLAGAAGDADHLDAGPAADGGGQALQRREAVVDDDARRGGRQSRRGTAADDHGRSASRQCLRGVLVAVEALALQPDEEVSRLQVAAVGTDAPHLHAWVGRLEAAAAGLRDFGERQLKHGVTGPRRAPRSPLRRPCGRRKGSCGRR